MKSLVLSSILLFLLPPWGITPLYTINQHRYVDLGLPSGLLWADRNVGANIPAQSGDYFSWGEIDKRPLGLYRGKTRLKKIPEYSGDTIYDVARVQWGAEWRTPTENELQELIDLCKWEWTERNGSKGYTVTGPNGASIFIPMGGISTSDGIFDALSLYWSSTPSTSSYSAACMIINPDKDEYPISIREHPRKNGGMVRPVHNPIRNKQKIY